MSKCEEFGEFCLCLLITAFQGPLNDEKVKSYNMVIKFREDFRVSCKQHIMLHWSIIIVDVEAKSFED